MTLRRVFLSLATLALLSFVTLLIANQRGQPDWPVTGYHQAMVTLPGESAPSAVHLWYPATSGPVTLVGQSALFWGASVRIDAPPPESLLPVILFSHGSGGRAFLHFGLLTALADAGYLVIAPDHPGSTSGDSDPAVTLDLGRRPAHLSFLIDWVVQNRPVGVNIDPDHIGVAGFSMGGFSALSLAGVRADASAMAAYCAAEVSMPDCQWYANGGIDLSALDGNRFGGRFADPRIRAVLAIDPALPRAADAPSLSAVRVPVAIVNFRDGAIPTGMDWSGPTAALPDAVWMALDGANHFSGIDPCRRIGRIVIGLAAGGEGLCRDTTPTPRQTTQAALRALAVAFFDRALAQ